MFNNIMYTLCCMSLTLAARIIATVGLSFTILLVNIVISEFFGRPKEEFFNSIEPWTLLGLNWTRFIASSSIPNRVAVLVIFSCFLVYLGILLITTSLLAVATVLRKPLLSAPWLYFQIVGIADQLIALILHFTSTPDPATTERSHWYIPLCSLYLMCTVYFWMVVFAASEQWSLNLPRSCIDHDLSNAIADEPIQIIQQLRTEKSPSFLAQNHIFSEIVIPPLPDKYDIV